MSKLPIAEIIVRPRVRSDLGNISEFAEDIKNRGMLHPVIVNQNRELVAGYRRLQVAVSLGWTEIPVTIIPTEPSLAQFDMQLAENMKRKNLNPLEISEAILERKHRFEQVHGKIENGGYHPSKDTQKTSLPSGQTAVPQFYAETGKLLNMSPFSIYKFLQLNELDADLKDQVRTNTIGYRAALTLQAERKRINPAQKKSNSAFKSVRLPNQQDIAPLQKQYQSTPTLMKLFMLIQHSEQIIRQLHETPLEFDKFELEYLFGFIQQLDKVIAYYQELLHQLTQTQEKKINELAEMNNNG
jgi:hypothetical protein